MINEVKGCVRQWSWPKFKFYPGICQEGVTSEVMASLVQSANFMDYYIHFIYQAASAEGFAVGLTPKNVYMPLIGK